MAWLDDTLKKIVKPIKEVVEAPYELVTGKGHVGKIGKKIAKAAKDLAPDVLRGVPLIGETAAGVWEGVTAKRRFDREQDRAQAAAERAARKARQAQRRALLDQGAAPAPQRNMLPWILGGGALLLILALTGRRR